MRRAALILAFLMVVGILIPASSAHVDPSSPLAVYCIVDLDQTYTIGSEVTVNVLVYWEGAFHDPVDVAPQLDGRPLTEVRRAEGKYEVKFTILQSDVDERTSIPFACFVNEGSYPAPWTADTIYIPVKSLEMDIIVPDSHDRFMSPGDECQLRVTTRFDGRLVDVDDGTLWVWRQLQDNTYQGTIAMTRVSTGVYEGVLQTPTFNTTMIWHVGAEAAYTTRDGIVYGGARDVVEVEMFPLWIKRASVSTTATTLEFHVWEENGWPLPDSVEGYPMAGAQVALDYEYYDGSMVLQERSASGTTGLDGKVSLDLSYPDMNTQHTRFLVSGVVTVGQGISAHRQHFDFYNPVRDYPDVRDIPGFDVQLHNYYLPEWQQITTLGHTARFDGQPLVGATIYVYIAEDDWVYYAGSVITGPQGYFNVQLKTPPLPEGERYLVVDKCEYSVQVAGDWYLDSNWLYFGEANLYGEFNRTSDEQVSMEVSNLKDYQVVHVTLDHPEADGRDETALITWGVGDPWDYWLNQDWLYGLTWAPVRPHWFVYPSNYQYVTFVPAYYKGGAWHADFYLPGFLPDTLDVWINGEILFTDTNVAVSTLKQDLSPAEGKGWPDVAISTPTIMSIYEGDLNISGTASDDWGLEGVEVRIDGGQWMACDGLDDWYYMLDTTTMAYGDHLVEARAWNGDHYSKLASRSFFTDQSPRVTVENPEDGGHYPGNITVNGTAWDDLSVDLVQVQLDGGAWTDANGTTAWDLPIDTSAMDSGDHTLGVKAVAGSRESEIARLVFVVDRIPEIKITDPPADAELSGTVHVKGEAQDDLSLLEVHLSIDGGEWFPASEEEQWSYALDTTTLDYGEHHVEARAWDGHEWSDTAYVAFTVDNPPEITSVSLADGQVISGVHRVDGESKDDNHGDDHVVQVVIDGGNSDEVPVEENGDWMYEIDATGLTPGQHNIAFRIYDGKLYSDQWSVSFLVDEPPSVGDISIDAGDTLEGEVTVTGGSSDDTGVDGVQVRVDGGDWVDVTVDEDGNWSYDMDTTELDHGDHTLEVRVSDGVQWSVPTAVDFAVDQRPVVTVSSPEEGAKYKKDFDFTGAATDDDEVMRVEVRLDGGDWQTAEGITNWSVAMKLKDLKKGEHTGEVRAYDGTQYSDVVSITFQVDKESDEGPGFGLLLTGVAMLGAVLALVVRRR